MMFFKNLKKELEKWIYLNGLKIRKF
jgi:hypothetical protein